jgi:N12 class adenine-specific DNA methylase
MATSLYDELVQADEDEKKEAAAKASAPPPTPTEGMATDSISQPTAPPRDIYKELLEYDAQQKAGKTKTGASSSGILDKAAADADDIQRRYEGRAPLTPAPTQQADDDWLKGAGKAVAASGLGLAQSVAGIGRWAEEQSVESLARTPVELAALAAKPVDWLRTAYTGIPDPKGTSPSEIISQAGKDAVSWMPEIAKKPIIGSAEKSIGIDKTIGQTAGDYFGEKVKEYTPKTTEDTAKHHVLGALQSLGPAVGMMLAGILTKKPGLALNMFFLNAAGTEYDEQRREGTEAPAATAAGIVSGVAEKYTEKISYGAWSKEGVGFLKRMLKGTALDVPGEMLATVVQEGLVKKATTKPDLSMADFLHSIKDTAIQAALVGPAQTAILHPVIRHIENKQIEKITEETNSKTFDKLPGGDVVSFYGDVSTFIEGRPEDPKLLALQDTLKKALDARDIDIEATTLYRSYLGLSQREARGESIDTAEKDRIAQEVTRMGMDVATLDRSSAISQATSIIGSLDGIRKRKGRLSPKEQQTYDETSSHLYSLFSEISNDPNKVAPSYAAGSTGIVYDSSERRTEREANRQNNKTIADLRAKIASGVATDQDKQQLSALTSAIGKTAFEAMSVDGLGPILPQKPPEQVKSGARDTLIPDGPPEDKNAKTAKDILLGDDTPGAEGTETGTTEAGVSAWVDDGVSPIEILETDDEATIAAKTAASLARQGITPEIEETEPGATGTGTDTAGDVWSRMPDDQLQGMADQGVNGAKVEIAKRLAAVGEITPPAEITPVDTVIEEEAPIVPETEPEITGAGKVLYRGTGREDAGAAYNEMTDQKPILEGGQFWTLNEKDASNYGPNIESQPMPTFTNPLTITNDEQWKQIVQTAVGQYDTPTERVSYPNPTGMSPDKMAKWRKGMSDYLASNNHDAMIIDMDGAQGDEAKTLGNAFGHSQVFIPETKGGVADGLQGETETEVKDGSVGEAIDQAANEAATSPTNELPEPTEGQKKAGNYKMGHVNLDGLDISIENPAGSVRKGVDENGKPWETPIAHHYGYIKKTEGKDGDHVDVFLGPNPDSARVFIVDQQDPKTEKFDEHKTLVGFNTPDEARAGYLANYDETGPSRIMGITEMSMDEFKEWLKGDTTKRVSKEEAAIETGPAQVTANSIFDEEYQAAAIANPQPHYSGMGMPPASKISQWVATAFGNVAKREGISVEHRAELAESFIREYKGNIYEREVLKGIADNIGIVYTKSETTQNIKAKIIEAIKKGPADKTAVLRMTLEEAVDRSWPPGKNVPDAPDGATTSLNGQPATKSGDSWSFIASANGQQITITDPRTAKGLDYRVAITEAYKNGYYEQAVADGVLTQEKADEILRALPAGIKALPGEGAVEGEKPGEISAPTLTGIDAELAGMGKNFDFLDEPAPPPGQKTPTSGPRTPVAGGRQEGVPGVITGLSELQGGGHPPTAKPAAHLGAKDAEQALAMIKEQGLSGAADALMGLYKLFGGGTPTKTPDGPSPKIRYSIKDQAAPVAVVLDKDAYENAKPLFESSYQHALDVGETVKQFYDNVVAVVGDAVRPYLKHFLAVRQAQTLGEQEPAFPGEVVAPPAEDVEGAPEGEVTGGPSEDVTADEPVDVPAEEDDVTADPGFVGGARFRGPKLQNAGGLLAGSLTSKDHSVRIRDIIVALDQVAVGEPKEIVAAILRLTTKADLFKFDAGPEGRTPGLVRWLTGFRSSLSGFLEYAGYDAGGSRRKHRTSFHDALVELVETPDGQAEVRRQAAKYISMLRGLQEATFDSISIAQAVQNIYARILLPGETAYFFEDGSDPYGCLNAFGHDFAGHTKNGKLISIRELQDRLGRISNDMIESENDPTRDLPIVRRPINIADIVTSDEWRHGENRNGDDLMNTFGLRAVNYGEWTNAAHRQISTNLFYDSCMDLLKLMGAPEQAISYFSYGERLGMAFGAQGRGKATGAAHYDGTNHLINLTRDHGDGSVAHEMMHKWHLGVALSHEGTNVWEDMIDALKTEYRLENLEQRVEDILRGLDYDIRRWSPTKNRLEDARAFLETKLDQEFKHDTSFMRDAVRLDGGLEGKYWSKGTELMSRAFEAFVADELQGTNDYLVDVSFVAPGAVQALFNRSYAAYPTESEREKFNTHFKRMFEGMEWTEDGKIKMKTDFVLVSKQQKADAEATVQKILDKLEEWYNLIYKGYPSADGRYWYAYRVTARGVQMQPTGISAYDDEYRIEQAEGSTEEILGTGAVAYLEHLTPDDVVKYRLTPINHDTTPTTRELLEGEDGIPRDDSDTSMEGESAQDGRGPRIGGTPQGSPELGGRQDGGGNGLVDAEGNPVVDSGGDSEGAVHVPDGGGTGIPHAGSDALPAERIDFVIHSVDSPTNATKVTAFNGNLTAIRTLKKIEAEGRLATAAEQKLLFQFQGWGNLSDVLRSDPQEAWRDRAELLQQELTSDELRDARANMLTGYYTPLGIYDSLYRAMSKFGFTGGRVISTGAGILHEYGVMPDNMRRLGNMTAIEKDSISARIAQQLYQTVRVINTPLEQASLPPGYYDLAFTNVPFADSRPFDETDNPDRFVLHDYFINKQLSLLRAGGFLVNITSAGTMDGENTQARDAFSKKADLIAAFRLPTNTFKDQGTPVVTDILIMRKRFDGEVPNGTKFKDTVEFSYPATNKDGSPAGFTWEENINEYFIANPGMVLGDMSLQRGGRWGNPMLMVTGPTEGASLTDRLDAAIQTLPDGLYKKELSMDQSDIADRIPAADFAKDGGIFVRNGNLMVNLAGISEPWEPKIIKSGAKKDIPEGMKYKDYLAQVKRMMVHYVHLRGVMRDLLRTQQRNQPEMEQFRKELNDSYNDFVSKFGRIGEQRNLKHILRDVDGGQIAALEIWKYPESTVELNEDGTVKEATEITDEEISAEEEAAIGVFHSLAAIFTQNTAKITTKPTSADNVTDALLYSLMWSGRVDLAFMEALTGTPRKEIINQLQGQIFEDPALGGWVTRDEYLSGNVKDKLKAAEIFAVADDSFNENVRQLKAIIPIDLETHQIPGQLGATWISGETITEFANELMGVNRFRVRYIPAATTWTIEITGHGRDNIRYNKDRVNSSVAATSTWGTHKVGFFASDSGGRGLLDYALNGGMPRVFGDGPMPRGGWPPNTRRYTTFDDNGNAVHAFNPEETEAAYAKLLDLRDKFETWLWENPARATANIRLYNDIHNQIVDRTFDGAHLTLPGKVPDEIIKLAPHQLNAVWRALTTRKSYFAHGVGVGKTFAFTAAIMEMKRLGIVHKAVVAVKAANLDQIRSDIYRLYPAANVLTVDIKSANRKEDLRKISVGNYDVIIMTHQALGRIKVSPDTQLAFLRIQEDKLRRAMIAENARSGRSKQAGEREIQKKLAKLVTRINALLNTQREEGLPVFEEMGIDMLVVDEAHVYKNLDIQTNYQGVKGIKSQASHRAEDILMKTQYILNINGGLIFASGTPISNSIGELYGLQQHFQAEELSRVGIDGFDQWVATFGQIGQKAEPSPAGDGLEIITRFLRFRGIPELMGKVRKFMDIVTADEIGIRVPSVANPDGKPTLIEIPPSKTFLAHLQSLIRRAFAFRLNFPRYHDRPAGLPPSHKHRWEQQGPMTLVCMDCGTRAEGANYRGVPDNMPRILTDGRKMALDPRSIDPDLEDNPNTKVNFAVEEIVAMYYGEHEAEDPVTGKRYFEKKGVQLVFSDQGVPNTENFNVYADIKQKLIARGIPESEIAFIQDATLGPGGGQAHELAKRVILEKARQGSIRILLGGTQNLGTGTNVQDRVVAVHNLDADWNAANQTQRIGRAIRRGNAILAVYINNYGIKKGVDAFMWNTIGQKQNVIAQLLSKNPLRESEDIGIDDLGANEFAARLADNPLVQIKFNLENEVRKLRSQRAVYDQTKREQQAELQAIPQYILGYREKLKPWVGGTEILQQVTAVKIGTEFFDLSKEGGKVNDLANNVFPEATMTAYFAAQKTMTDQVEALRKAFYEKKNPSAKALQEWRDATDQLKADFATNRALHEKPFGQLGRIEEETVRVKADKTDLPAQFTITSTNETSFVMSPPVGTVFTEADKKQIKEWGKKHKYSIVEAPTGFTVTAKEKTAIPVPGSIPETDTIVKKFVPLDATVKVLPATHPPNADPGMLFGGSKVSHFGIRTGAGTKTERQQVVSSGLVRAITGFKNDHTRSIEEYETKIADSEAKIVLLEEAIRETFPKATELRNDTVRLQEVTDELVEIQRIAEARRQEAGQAALPQQFQTRRGNENNRFSMLPEPGFSFTDEEQGQVRDWASDQGYTAEPFSGISGGGGRGFHITDPNSTDLISIPVPENQGGALTSIVEQVYSLPATFKARLATKSEFVMLGINNRDNGFVMEPSGQKFIDEERVQIEEWAESKGYTTVKRGEGYLVYKEGYAPIQIPVPGNVEEGTTQRVPKGDEGEKFYLNGMLGPEAVAGEVVENPFGLYLFVYEDKNTDDPAKLWGVADRIAGVTFENGTTKQAAINKTLDRIRALSVNVVRDSLNKQAEENGVSPWAIATSNLRYETPPYTPPAASAMTDTAKRELDSLRHIATVKWGGEHYDGDLGYENAAQEVLDKLADMEQPEKAKYARENADLLEFHEFYDATKADEYSSTEEENAAEKELQAEYDSIVFTDSSKTPDYYTWAANQARAMAIVAYYDGNRKLGIRAAQHRLDETKNEWDNKSIIEARESLRKAKNNQKRSNNKQTRRLVSEAEIKLSQIDRDGKSEERSPEFSDAIRAAQKTINSIQSGQGRLFPEIHHYSLKDKGTAPKKFDPLGNAPPTDRNDIIDRLEFWLNNIEASRDAILSGNGSGHDARVIHQGPIIAMRMSNWLELGDNERWVNEFTAVDRVSRETLGASLIHGMPKGWKADMVNEAEHYASYIKDMRAVLDKELQSRAGKYSVKGTITEGGQNGRRTADSESKGTGRAGVLPEVREEHARRVDAQRQIISKDDQQPDKLREAIRRGAGLAHDPQGYDTAIYTTVQGIASRFGVDIIPIKDTSDTINALVTDGNIFINLVSDDAGSSVLQTVLHELSHVKGNSGTQEKIDTTSAAFSGYRKRLNLLYFGSTLRTLSESRVMEEYAADLETGAEDRYGVNLRSGLKKGATVETIQASQSPEQGKITFKDGRVYVDGKDHGKFETTKRGNEIEIDRLYLDKDKQKQGLGKEALRELFNKNPDVNKLKVYPLPSSEPYFARFSENVSKDGYFEITRDSLNKGIAKSPSPLQSPEQGKGAAAHKIEAWRGGGVDQSIRGFFFTTAEKRAAKYGDAKKYTFELDNPYRTDFEGATWDKGNREWNNIDDVAEYAKAEGYDGVIVENVRGNPGDAPATDYVVFDKAKVKVKSPEQGKGDAAYLKAVESGDMETAQKMVDDAAKVAGYKVGPVYHGTDKEGIKVFDPSLAGTVRTSDWTNKGIYFAPSAWWGDSYREEAIVNNNAYDKELWQEYEDAAARLGTTPMMSGINLGVGSEKYNELGKYEKKWRANRESLRKSDAGKVYSAFLKLDNPMYYAPQGITDPFLDEQARGYGHDGIIIGSEDSIEEIIVFNPNQIKSADAITYDDNGNVIPLSERFNEETPDIRYSLQTKNPAFKEWFGKSKIGSVLAGNKTTPPGARVQSLIPEVEQRIRDSKGGSIPTIRERAKTAINTTWDDFSRHFPYIDPKIWGAVTDVLRRFQEVPLHAKEETVTEIEKFVRKLSSEDRHVFGMNLILNDMLRDIDSDLKTAAEGQMLQFGYANRDEVQRDLDNFSKAADNNPDIREALNKRNAYVGALTAKMIALKILNKNTVNDASAYFHHQVLLYLRKNENPNFGMSSRDVRKHTKNFMMKRGESVLDYNTEYVEAEFEFISQALVQIKTVETIAKLKELADQKPALVSEAKEKNLATYREKTADYLEDPLKPFNVKMAIGFRRLAKLAADGDIDVPAEFDGVLEHIVEQEEQRKEAAADEFPFYPEQHPMMFPLLNYLMNHGGPGVMPAALIFKALGERTAKVREIVGKDWITYNNLIPDGYISYKPDKRQTFYFANTIADRIMELVLADQRHLLPSDVRKVLAKGQDEEWIIDAGIAKTLDDFRPKDNDSLIQKGAKGALTAWKQWILMNPFRIIKYNINNMSGDLDIVMAAEPGIIKEEFWQATKDLWAAFRGKADETVLKDLKKWTDVSVIGSGMTQMDIPELNDVHAVKGIVDFFDGKSKNAISRWYSLGKRLSTLRENILRLAAARYYSKRLERGENVGYGASNKEEIDQVRSELSKTELAAKMARELVGDYGNISHAGQYLRERVLPFYSWMEINAPRYVRLFRNLKHEGAGGLAPAAGVMVWKGTKLAMKASILMAMVMLYNAVVWPDEEDELQELGREQLHLILGRRADGTIITLRFQGALSDALSWFGMSNPVEQVKKIAQGKKGAQDVAWDVVKAPGKRLFQAVRPDAKMVGEVLSGQSYYPDPMHPRPIRDTTEHILRTFSLDKIWNRIDIPGVKIAKPQRGGSWEDQLVKDISGLVLNETDPGEQAYYTARKDVMDWLSENGKEKPAALPTNKSNALYYYKQSLKFSDFDAAAKYLKRYQDLGGKLGHDVQGSIIRTHPLSSLSLLDRNKYVLSLTNKERETLEIAKTWYKKHYLATYIDQRKQATP